MTVLMKAVLVTGSGEIPIERGGTPTFHPSWTHLLWSDGRSRSVPVPWLRVFLTGGGGRGWDLSLPGVFLTMVSPTGS